ncbi:RDD family protein [Paenibacillus sp. KQZ6P-2]|uniref:RDD family protein n=1 Tax=Paenibacillus mangrovi TaxID=2931978 RepID=A0A9X2B3Q0_9BACL|nr:RDD family protein [Paenibacillus mangrovi]MCJ8010802.1 RDD family protein [Paenibacillus mangrovi]
MKRSLRRLFAYWLDFVFLAIILVGIQWVIYTTTSGFPFDELNKGYQIEAWVFLSMSLPVWAYFIFCERFKQQTIGKRLLRLKVMNEKGSQITFAQAFFRTWIRLLPWELTHLIILVPTPWWNIEKPDHPALILIPNAMIVVYIAILLINKGRKTLHDYITKTTVVELPKKEIRKRQT